MLLQKLYYVYFIISPKGKIYVGYTSWNANKRFEKHVANSKKIKRCSPAIEYAILKYGADKMTVIEVRKCYSKQEAANWEIRYVAVLDSLSPKGYNLTRGGDGGGAEFREPASEETRAKIGAGAKGRGAKGIIGYHILGYTVEFDVIKDAEKEFNLPRGEINKCAKGLRGVRGGFIWKYKDIEERAKYPEWDITRTCGTKLNQLGRPVYRILEDGTKDVYPSSNEVKRILGITNLYKSLTKGQKSGGYRWFYDD